MGIQWQPEINALTSPQSYRPRFVPKEVLGYDELAADMVRDNPTWSESLTKAIMMDMTEKIKQALINGKQVTLEKGFTYRPSLTGRMNAPEDPLPVADDLLQVKVYASRPFVDDVRHAAQFERLPAEEKMPLINTAEDTRLNLPDVLNSKGMVRLLGSNLLFDQKEPGSGCVIEGTRSGKTVQEQFGTISNSEILLVPDIPVQTNPWNNEYTLSVSTHYTEHGTLRTGTYRRRLRSPLVIEGFGDGTSYGILTGSANTPYARVIGGMITASERLRIQVILDPHDGLLHCSLIDMTDGGKAGAVVTVARNDEYILPGFAGSAVSSLHIEVAGYNLLLGMIRNFYAGRIVDILDVTI